MKKLLFILFFSCFSVLLVACGPQKVEYNIELTEFSFTPDTIEVKVGQEVTLHLVNKGALNHEFMVGRNVMMMEGMANGFETDFLGMAKPTITGSGFTVMGLGEGEDEMDQEHAMAGHEGAMVMMDGNQPETVATVTFTVTEDMVGEWEIACFSDNGTHYAQGMKGKLIVSP